MRRLLAWVRDRRDVLVLSQENRRLAAKVVTGEERVAHLSAQLTRTVRANTEAGIRILGLEADKIALLHQLAARDAMLDECEARLAAMEAHQYAGVARFQRSAGA